MEGPLDGGTLIALLFIVGAIRNKPMPSNVNWLVLGLTLIIAAFLAWRREWIENGKGFIDATPLQIAKLVWDVTGVAARSHIRPYRNKWIRVTGRLTEVTDLVFPMMYVRVEYGDQAGKRCEVVMAMSRWKAAPFVPLPRGTTVTVAGRIKKITGYMIDLSDVEFISAEGLPASTPDRQSPLPSQE